jgi:hypothetical protein
MQNFDHNIGFWENANFFAENCQKLQKIVIITSTPCLDGMYVLCMILEKITGLALPAWSCGNVSACGGLRVVRSNPRVSASCLGSAGSWSRRRPSTSSSCWRRRSATLWATSSETSLCRLRRWWRHSRTAGWKRAISDISWDRRW